MAQYPPPGAPPSRMPPINAPRRGPGPYCNLDSISEGWQLLTQDFGTWFGSGAIILIAYYMINTPIQMGLQFAILGSPLKPRPTDMSAMVTFYVIYAPVAILLQSLLMVFQTGLTNMAVLKQEGYAISVGDLGAVFPHFGKLYVTCLLQSIITTFGICACFIPGLYAYGTLFMAPMMVLRQGLKPIDALQASYNTMRSQAWSGVGVLFATGILSMLGVLACCVGFLATYPLIPIVMGILYYNFHQPDLSSGYATPEGFVPYPRGYVPPAAPQAPQPGPEGPTPPGA